MDSASHALRPYTSEAQGSSLPAAGNPMRHHAHREESSKREPNKKIVLRSAAAVQATGNPEDKNREKEKDRAVQFLERVRNARAERRERQRAKRKTGSQPLAS
eukprot:3360148-Amphidinium_carterae.1